MTHKSIEIYYDVATIPGITDRTQWSNEALTFRNAAMEHIEEALLAAEAGEWEGAEIGGGEVNFGFGVDDFDVAEGIIRAAVAGTDYEGIRDMQRREFSDEDFAEGVDMADDFQMPLRLKLMIALVVPATLIFMALKLITLPLRLLLKR